MQNPRGKAGQQKGVTMRIRQVTKVRLDKLRHPGQSYDGLLEELLSFYEAFQTTRGGERPLSEEPPRRGEGRDENWWWQPGVRRR